MTVGIYLRNCRGVLLNGNVDLSHGTGYLIEDCHDLLVEGARARIGSNRTIKLAGRNDPCPCGSLLKYKKCHLGKNMATGIKSTGSNSTFKDTVIHSTDVGVDLRNDSSSFENTKIVIGSPDMATRVIEELNLPQDTPHVYIWEAVKELQSTAQEKSLESSKLKTWLIEAGMTPAFWATTALAIVGLIPK